MCHETHATDVIFISQPRDVGITCRQDKVAMFPCQYTGSNTHPHWMINSTFYSSLDLYLPPDLSYEDNILTVTNLRSKNGSTYQCVLFSSEGCMYKSTVGQLKCEGKHACIIMIMINNDMLCVYTRY